MPVPGGKTAARLGTAPPRASRSARDSEVGVSPEVRLSSRARRRRERQWRDMAASRRARRARRGALGRERRRRRERGDAPRLQHDGERRSECSAPSPRRTWPPTDTGQSASRRGVHPASRARPAGRAVRIAERSQKVAARVLDACSAAIAGRSLRPRPSRDRAVLGADRLSSAGRPTHRRGCEQGSGVTERARTPTGGGGRAPPLTERPPEVRHGRGPPWVGVVREDDEDIE